MLAAASGAEVIGVDLIPERLELSRYAGAAHVLMGGEEAAREIRDHTDGRGTEVGMDCSGSAAGRKLCLEAAHDWGRVVYIGEGGSVTFEPSPLLLHKQLTLYGSWVCGINEMGDLLEHLDRKGLHPGSTVTNTFSLSEDLRAGKITLDEFHEAESCMHRSHGHCMVMGTASTMASIAEALGMALPGTAAIPAVHADRLRARDFHQIGGTASLH